MLFKTVTIVFLSFFLSVYGIKDETNQERWEQPQQSGPDAEVPGFLINLGPTGMRAILTEKTFVVKYIFKGSPAEGKVNLNDVITGVNGKAFNSHTFGGDKKLGIEGPMYDFGMGIEESEGGDGVLELMIKRGTSDIKVSIQLEKLGKFSATFPENCPKSKLLRKRALDYLATNPGMGVDGRCASILALISSEDKSHQAAAKAMISQINKVPGAGTWTWNLSFRSIALAEYYLLTKDASVLGALKGTLDLLRVAQYKSPNISIWKAEEGQSQEKLDEHQQLYEGGFGHAPFRNGHGNGGYGPMQFQTILAVISWQLGRECGIPLKHEGITQALKFMDYGTNSAGNVAYGGEFTLAFGFRDPVKFKNGTNGGNPQKSGLSIIAYNLTPEYEKSEGYLKLHRQNIDNTFKGMQNGHADGIMAMTWGMLGVGASNDEKLKRKVFDHFKAWLNITRCHSSNNYVALPNRDYADGAYYRDKHRAHATALAALVYSFCNPKLMVHGVKVAIPGVNHKELESSLKVAYTDILSGNYGTAAGKILAGSSDPESDGGRMLAFLNNKIKTQLMTIEKNIDSGHWLTASNQFNELDLNWKGVPLFDEKQNSFKTLITDPGGKHILTADQAWQSEKFSAALQLAMAALKTTSLDKVRNTSGKVISRINFKAYEYSKQLKIMEVKGEWFTMLNHLKKIPKTYGGISIVDKVVTKLTESINTPSGKGLTVTHKYMLEGNFSKAYKMANAVMQKAEIERHKKIAEIQTKNIKASVETKVAQLQKLKQDGNWNTLQKELLAIKSTHAGIKAYNDFHTANLPLMRSSGGRILVSGENLIQNGKYSLATQSLEKVIQTAGMNQEIKTISGKLIKEIELLIKPKVDHLLELEKQGDWYALKNDLQKMNRDLNGIKVFDDEKARLSKKFLEAEINTIIKAGKEYSDLYRKWSSRKSDFLRKKIHKFIEENNNLYGEKAKSLIEG